MAAGGCSLPNVTSFEGEYRLLLVLVVASGRSSSTVFASADRFVELQQLVAALRQFPVIWPYAGSKDYRIYLFNYNVIVWVAGSYLATDIKVRSYIPWKIRQRFVATYYFTA